MGNSIAWPMIRLIQRLSMILTVACCAYIIFFLVFNNKKEYIPQTAGIISKKSIDLIKNSPIVSMNPSDTSTDVQPRDIFSLSTPSVSASGDEESTPKGQLPDHLKVVGILISKPSQIIIEDSSANKTYFIDEGKPQSGIKIVRVSDTQMIINYQGQDISVPINKNGD